MEVNQSKLIGYCHNIEHPLKIWETDCKVNCYNCDKPRMNFSSSCRYCRAPAPVCLACGKRLGDQLNPFYYCELCKGESQHFIHKSCTEFTREIQLPNHRHPLLLVKDTKSGYQNRLKCGFCKFNLDIFMFRCEQCDIQIDWECAMTCIKHHENRDHIQHFSHEHPMAFFPELVDNNDDTPDCKVCCCPLSSDDPTYGCAPCGFFIHKTCLDELKHEIQLPFHPHLMMVVCDLGSRSSSYCGACCSLLEVSLFYHCYECRFDLHIRCAYLMPSINYRNHNHLLTVINSGRITSVTDCEACASPIEGDHYFARCLECDLNYHFNCDTNSLAPILENKLHKHPLTLTLMNVETILHCDVCLRFINRRESFYCCHECKYSVHVHCITIELELPELEKVLHFSHLHLLTRYENKTAENNNFSCYGCEKQIDHTTLSYWCKRCKAFLHDSCFDLQMEISQHPLHPVHTLSLPNDIFTAIDRRCHACNKRFNGLAYQCIRCSIDIDLECISLDHRVIKIENHEHELTFFKKLYGKPQCIACGSTSLEANYLRCLECDYNIHVMCSPLPENFEHVSHQEHQLTLVDYFAEDESDGEQYCDYCEEIRNPEESVYCCQECHFVADFSCVIDEVLLLMEGAHGEVKFRPTDQIKKGLTAQQVFDSLSEDEKIQLETIRRTAYDKLYGILSSRIGEDMVSGFDYARYLEDIFNEIPQVKLDFDWDDEVVKVEHYKVPRSLAIILEKILEIHGDIGAKCNLTPKLKMYLVCLFCATVQSMWDTRVKDVEEKLLYNWLWSFKVGECAGLNVEFAIQRLREIKLLVSEVHEDKIKRNHYILELVEKKKTIFETVNELLEEAGEIDEELEQSIEATPSETAREEKEIVQEILEKRMGTAGGILLKGKAPLRHVRGVTLF